MMIMVSNWRKPLVWIVKANLLFLAIDLLVLILLVVFFSFDFLVSVKAGYFSAIFLLEAGIVFLIGGLIAMSSSIFVSKVKEHVFHSDEEWSIEKHEKSGKKANLYLLTGVLLFVESLILSILI